MVPRLSRQCSYAAFRQTRGGQRAGPGSLRHAGAEILENLGIEVEVKFGIELLVERRSCNSRRSQFMKPLFPDRRG